MSQSNMNMKKRGMMSPRQKQRMYVVIAVIVAAFVVIGFAMFASRDNLNLYYSPEQVEKGEAPLDKTIRVGGLVVPGTLHKGTESLAVEFALVDGSSEQIIVSYEGILPDLFREGQGIIARGKLIEGNQFVAEEILAKHDEEYMPPEVAATLESQGHPFKEKDI
ncbi:cytochrome c maturation protein CcmE [Ignatzschineria sp. LJL83]